MDHNLPLITTLASAFGLALLLGFGAVRLGLPALVGYLLAGILIGPFTPGFIASTAIAAELAEVGVMLLMFGVGLHFSLQDLLKVRKLAIPGALLQILLSTLLGTALAASWGWPLAGALVFGLALSVASTVVLLRALEASGTLDSANGHLVIGWVVVQDLAMVLVLVLLPPLSGLLSGQGSDPATLWPTLGLTLLKVTSFIAVMLLAGRKVFPWLLWQVARTGSRELFTLCVVAAAVCIAFGAAQLFDVSFALGAFFAGMMLRESEFSHRAAEESLPLRDAFAVLFFVSVGMLFDPQILLEQPGRILAVLGVILLGTPAVSALLVVVLRYPLNTALTVAACLAQIGEFSFILAGLGRSLGLLPDAGQQLLLAGALCSIALNPLAFRLNQPLQNWLRSRSALARKLERPSDPLAELPMSTDEKFLSGQVVVVGYGRVGRRITQTLQQLNIPYVVAEQDRGEVERLRQAGIAAVCGDAAEAAVLIQAHIARAGMLIVTPADALLAHQAAETARLLNPGIEIVLHASNDDEAALLASEASCLTLHGAEVLAECISQHAAQRYGRQR